MIRRYALLLVLGAVTLAALPQEAMSQVRPERTVFLKPKVGISWYLGDNERSPFNFNMDTWDVRPPYNAGLEIGYQFSVPLSLSLGYQLGEYPLIPFYGDEVPPNYDAIEEGIDTQRHSFQLLVRYLIGGETARVAPFVETGLNVSLAPTGGESYTGFGPVAGAGLDIVLGDKTSLIFEVLSNITTPDESMDGQPGDEHDLGVSADGFGGVDFLNSFTLGLKYSFKGALTPVDVLALDCPAQLEVGETGTFTATVDENATMPVEYRWDFGDGAMGTGLLATHSFSSAGTYTVNFMAMNRGSEDAEACVVEVVPAPVPAEIITLNASDTNIDVCTPNTVSFTTSVRGDEPVEYSWDFGDGSTGTGPSPTHTYSEEGVFTVTLTVTNAAGSDTESITITAVCESICDDITELNSVFFNRNSSTLTDDARASLEENLEILEECPNICGRIEGYSSAGERQPQELSEDRARAVQQFYTDNGIAGSRLLALGMGRVGGTSKKSGLEQFRRADTIPVPCDDMMQGMDSDDDM